MSDDAGRTVYHVACALELATDLLVDLYTFFSPPAPYECLFTATNHEEWPLRPNFGYLRICEKAKTRNQDDIPGKWWSYPEQLSPSRLPTAR